MKRHGLLHAELNRIVAAMGHTDTLVIADVGLPVPPGVVCIDLAVVGGLPSFLAVFEAVFAELCVERVTFAREVQQANPSVATLASGLISRNTIVDEVSHDEFKRLCASAVAVVRTGETSPYANAILHAGVTF